MKEKNQREVKFSNFQFRFRLPEMREHACRICKIINFLFLFYFFNESIYTTFTFPLSIIKSTKHRIYKFRSDDLCLLSDIFEGEHFSQIQTDSNIKISGKCVKFLEVWLYINIYICTEREREKREMDSKRGGLLGRGVMTRIPVEMEGYL